MNPTTAIGGAGTAVLSVDSLASVIHWLAIHYSITPLPDDVESKAAAVLFLATGGTVIGGAWWFVRTLARRWLKQHNMIEESEHGQVINP